MAIPARPARGRKTVKRGPGKRIVEGKSFRLADEVRYIQRRAADYDSRIVTIGQLILFSIKTGDAWLLDGPVAKATGVTGIRPHQTAKAPPNGATSAMPLHAQS